MLRLIPVLTANTLANLVFFRHLYSSKFILKCSAYKANMALHLNSIGIRNFPEIDPVKPSSGYKQEEPLAPLAPLVPCSLHCSSEDTSKATFNTLTTSVASTLLLQAEPQQQANNGAAPPISFNLENDCGGRIPWLHCQSPATPTLSQENIYEAAAKVHRALPLYGFCPGRF